MFQMLTQKQAYGIHLKLTDSFIGKMSPCLKKVQYAITTNLYSLSIILTRISNEWSKNILDMFTCGKNVKNLLKDIF